MVNKVILIGRLGKDPEKRVTQGGAPVTNFSIATTEKYTDRSGAKQESTEWHHIILWNKLADLAEQYLRKGSLVYIEGKITTEEWDDKDGKKQRTTKIIGYAMKFLEPKPQGQQGPNQGYAGQKTGYANQGYDQQGGYMDDGIPY